MGVSNKEALARRHSRSSQLELFLCFVSPIPADAYVIVVRTGFWTYFLSPVFWAGLSQIAWFLTYRKSAAIPVFQDRINVTGTTQYQKKVDKFSWYKYFGAKFSKHVQVSSNSASGLASPA